MIARGGKPFGVLSQALECAAEALDFPRVKDCGKNHPAEREELFDLGRLEERATGRRWDLDGILKTHLKQSTAGRAVCIRDAPRGAKSSIPELFGGIMPRMKALTYHGDKTIRLEQVPDPEILDPGDAIVRVQLCAVCGSDLHVYHGREQGLDHGCVMGHEFVGEIVALGSAPGERVDGEKVLSPFTTSCGTCHPCRLGLTSRCVSGNLFGWVQEGRGLQGGQAEYVRVPLAGSTLLPIPDGVPDEAALLLGDVFSTGWFCAEQAGIRPGDVCAVVGCGPVGLCAVMAAREMKAQRIFALDRVPERLALAQRLGAEPIDIERDDPVALSRDATNGLGVDAVLEVVGSAAAHRLALDLVRPGGTLSVVGVHTEETFSFSPVEAYDKNLTYRVGRCPARRLAAELLPLVQRRSFDFAAILSHRMALDEGVEAYRIFDEKLDQCIKVALIP
jgi:threonine dehydrogenase-like Zn-dependent dehydrogenase